MDWLPWIVAVAALVTVVLVLVRHNRQLPPSPEPDAVRRAEQLTEARLQLEAERTQWLDERSSARQALDDERAQLRAERERIAGLTRHEARQEVIDDVLQRSKLTALREARVIEQQARREAEQKARMVVVGAIQRVAAEQTAETVVTSIKLPSEDMKGRIIGKEGRNIRAFEQATGANLLIDEGQSVTISCFDPVRRETARVALTSLIEDGTIHPARVEHAVTKAKRSMEQRMRDVADRALADVGIADLDPGLLPYLGTLAFRTSYGQNVLDHLVECAHLAGAMAAELGLDVARCKRAAFLHDIGKALTHEREGSHALIGAELLRAHGELDDIVHAVEAHHGEVEPRTVEALLTQGADAISGSRPGARRESLEAYLERMHALERIATAKPGVAKAFAMQSGHEVRVLVHPEQVDDAAAQVLAHTIAQEIEDALTYPGLIHVTVVRESRAGATAH